ncbi:MAG: hypothetical protein MUF34_05190 [Polyangiaceae bacterium]|nr:hypothetical protein [Polyangiaceae bacterium]
MALASAGVGGASAALGGAAGALGGAAGAPSIGVGRADVVVVLAVAAGAFGDGSQAVRPRAKANATGFDRIVMVAV